jgi:predicted PurR-regulated permease PerM
MDERFNHFDGGKARLFLLAFIALLLGGAVLKITAPIVLPFVIALLFSFVMGPMVAFFMKWKIPRFCSIFLAVAAIIAGLYLMGMVLFSSAKAIIAMYPRFERRLTEIYAAVAGILDLSYDSHLSFIENLWAQLGVRTRIRNYTFSISNSFIGLLKDAFMVVVFLVFILLEASQFKEKLVIAFEDKWAGQIERISNGVVRQVMKYLSTKFLISLGTGLVVGVGLYLVGLEFAVFWGLIQFVLNFIPVVGSLVAGILASLFALLQFWPDPGPIILVALIMLGVNQFIGNVLEPKIMGDNLGLSPLAVLLSLTIWGYLWGFAGMILAVPMTVVVKIVCENVPVLEPVAVFLGSPKATVKPEEGEKKDDQDGEKPELEPQG